LVREKTTVKPARKAVVYDQSRWATLREKRGIAEPVMVALSDQHPIVHGSLARGDVHSSSDIDIVIDRQVPSYAIELALQDFGFATREIIQATPWHLIKGHIYLQDDLSVTFPLVKPTPVEEQFYKFGGSVDLESLVAGRRVPGIDKRLMLIEPTEEGHVETGVVGMESRAAKLIGVGLATVRERVDVLTRRDSIGRTGVYLTRALSPDESFEDVLRRIASRDTNVKRRFRGA
jgi:predicted nucleotidyltransferase